MSKPQIMVKEYTNVKHMNRDIQKFDKQGWRIVDTQTVTTKSENTGCGCLFGWMSGQSKHINKYVVRYERKAA